MHTSLKSLYYHARCQMIFDFLNCSDSVLYFVFHLRANYNVAKEQCKQLMYGCYEDYLGGGGGGGVFFFFFFFFFFFVFFCVFTIYFAFHFINTYVKLYLFVFWCLLRFCVCYIFVLSFYLV
jgi:hypothetical protein